MSSTLLQSYWQYNFPPFFTIQPNLQTRQIQLEAWNELILAYCKENSIYQLDTNQCLNQEPFRNSSINRALNSESLGTILEYMRSKGTIEWCDKSRNSFFVHWKKPDQWAKMIHDWAKAAGMVGTVCTLYELVNGDDTKEQPFHGMDMSTLHMALKSLEKSGKAVLISFEGSEGVKFL